MWIRRCVAEESYRSVERMRTERSSPRGMLGRCARGGGGEEVSSSSIARVELGTHHSSHRALYSSEDPQALLVC